MVILALHSGVNVYAAVPAAGLACAIAAWGVAFLVFRLRGAHFAIGTWVVAELFRILFANTSSLGGGSGISITEAVSAFGRWQREAYSLWMAIALSVAAIALVFGLLRSRGGLAFSAVRDNEVAAESLGVSVRSVKLADLHHRGGGLRHGRRAARHFQPANFALIPPSASIGRRSCSLRW